MLLYKSNEQGHQKTPTTGRREERRMLKYKFNVMEALKEAGYNTTKIRREKLLNESALQAFRENRMIGTATLDRLCCLLDMQPGNIIKYVEGSETEPKEEHEK